MPMQLVVPRAVTIAVAILAIICTMNFRVSFLLIMFNVSLDIPKGGACYRRDARMFNV